MTEEEPPAALVAVDPPALVALRVITIELRRRRMSGAFSSLHEPHDIRLRRNSIVMTRRATSAGGSTAPGQPVALLGHGRTARYLPRRESDLGRIAVIEPALRQSGQNYLTCTGGFQASASACGPRMRCEEGTRKPQGQFLAPGILVDFVTRISYKNAQFQKLR